MEFQEAPKFKIVNGAGTEMTGMVWLCRKDRTRILRQALELKLEGNRPTGQP
jgi:hypothetical protein